MKIIFGGKKIAGIQIVKSRRLQWFGHIERIGEDISKTNMNNI